MNSRKLLLTALTVSVIAVQPLTALAQGKGKSVKPLSAVALSRSVPSAFGETRIFRGRVNKDMTVGEKALLSGNYADAQDVFKKALNQNSRNLSALCGLGFALALQFKLDGAEQQFTKALAVKSDDSLAHIGMAFVKLNRLQSSSMTIIQQRKAILTQAESECTLALRAEPNMPEGLLVLGLIQKEQGNLAGAKASLTKSIAADPRYGAAFVNRGLIEMQQGDTASAIADYQEAIKLRSSNSTAHYALGVAYTQMGQLDKAYSELNTSLSLKGNSAPTHIAMGDVYGQQGNSVAAIKEYRAAIAIKAESETAYLKLADIMQGRGDLEMAAANLHSGLELAPNNVPLQLRLADISLQLGKLDDALNGYTTVLNVAPNSIDAVNGMTRALVLKAEKEADGAYFLSNNFESAERLIQKAISMNPNNMQLRLADAKLRAMAGQPVNLAAIGTPTTDPQRLSYAEAALAQYKFQDASQAMSTVIQNCQNAPDTFAVADIALMTRDLDSAEAAYNKAGSFPGDDVQSRAKRGVAAVGSARQKAQQDYNMAKDLASKNQFASALDKYRSAAYLNPRLAPAHLGLADALQKFERKDSSALREAAMHVKAYIALTPNLPEKEQAKLTKRVAKCMEVAYKIDQGHPPSRISSVFAPVGNLSRKVGSGIKGAFQ